MRKLMSEIEAGIEGDYIVTTPVQSITTDLPKVLGVSMEKIFTSIYGYGNNEDEINKWFIPLVAIRQFLFNLRETYYSYNYLPIYVDNDFADTDYFIYLSNKLTQHLTPYIPTFKKILELVNQSIESNRKLVIDTKRGGNNKDTKTFGNKIEGSSDTDSMNEVSPINATLGDIVTPNNKNTARFGSTTEKTGTDTIDYTIDETVHDTHTETSPIYFNEIMKIYEKYNIYGIIQKCYNKIIHEFNQSL